ncbi:MAG: hypothetical protein Q4E01_05685 [Actinomycetaceae bacterium]|nr:hypothetical protein [Actinomycetaceae bacterium]
MSTAAIKPSTGAEEESLEPFLGRGSIALISAIVSPVMLILLFAAAALMQEASVTGTPLGSPGGQLGMLVGAILIIGLAHTAMWSTIGIIISTVWAGFFAVLLLMRALVAGVPANSLEALLCWEQLPLQAFVILLTALISTRSQRRRRRESEPVDNAGVVEVSALGTVAFMFALSLVFLVLASAPSTITPIIMNDPSLTTRPRGEDWLIILIISCILSALTWLATKSVIVVQLAAWLVMLIPGMFIVPLISTLAGVVATPQDPQMLAISYSMPVIGVYGLMIVTATYAIALMNRIEPLPEEPSVDEASADEAYAEEPLG